MVLNNFDESKKYSKQQQFSNGVKGNPGVGFKLTNDGHFDMHGNRLCYLGDPDETINACTKYYTDFKIQSTSETVKIVADIKIHAAGAEIDEKISN